MLIFTRLCHLQVDGAAEVYELLHKALKMVNEVNDDEEEEERKGR